GCAAKGAGNDGPGSGARNGDGVPEGGSDQRIGSPGAEDGTMTKLPAGLSYEDTLEHIIEHIVLNITTPDNASADDIRASIREFSKTFLRINELAPASDSLIDEIAAEMIEWHALRPDEEGWNPELADAPAVQRLMDWNRR